MEISEIKQRLPLSQVLNYYGLKPDKSLRLQCPFHEDKTPSMQIYYKTHTAYCFSANCKTHGKSLDVIDFVMHKESSSKHEAIEKCKQLIGGTAAAGMELTKVAILSKMFIYFKNATHNSQPAQDYIKGRGLDHSQLEIGYNSGQFHHGTRREEALIQSCVQVGLLREGGRNTRRPEGDVQAYKPFGKYCIVFALRNRNGQVAGLYFRSTINDQEQRHFYLKDREGLYPRYPDSSTTKLILTESIIDAASLLQVPEISSQYSVLALYGTNGLTEEHQAAIAGLAQLEEIILMLDGDNAGRVATTHCARQLSREGVQISTINLPEGEDINSMAVSHQPEIFTHLLNERQPFLFSSEPIVKAVEAPEKKAAPEGIFNSSNPYKLSYATGTAQYYIQGGISKTLDSMKVTLVIAANEQKSRNKIDLYEDKAVEKLCKEASEKLNLDSEQIATALYKLTDLLDTYREKELLQEQSKKETPIPVLTVAERSEAESFLKQPRLIKRLNELLGQSGIVGEEQNRIFLLIVALSHITEAPLHALIQGSSGSGKTRLLQQIGAAIAAERVMKITRASDKSWYNYPEHYLSHKLVCIEDMDGLSEESGYAFRELQSNGELNSATSIKLENGQITSGQKSVKGPIASLACTTKGAIYEDNMSRCFLVVVDESVAQTKRVIAYQNNKAAGLIDSVKEQQVKTFIQSLCRLLLPQEVVNPYANKLQLPEQAHKIRRLNDLFQSFVKMITLLNQYQRKKDGKGRLISELEDIETAVAILFESIVLKVDELDGPLRQFYERLKSYLQKTHKSNHQQAAFSLREIRQALQLSKTQLFRYSGDLLQLEYIRQSGGHINKGFSYQVSYWDNHQVLREQIKTQLQSQLGTLRNASGTLEPA